MTSMTSIFLLLAFVCLMTGIFTPDIVIQWGFPSLKNRKNILITFGIMAMACLFLYELKEEPYLKMPEMMKNPINVSSKTHETSEKLIYQIGEIGRIEDVLLQLNEIQVQGDVISIMVSLKNDSDHIVDYHPYQFILKNSSGEILIPNLEDETTLTSGVLSPGDEVSGILRYMYPIEEYWFEYRPIAANLLSTITFDIGSETVNEMNHYGIGDIVSTSDTQLQVTEMKQLEKTEDSIPKKGHKFIKVDLALKNIDENTTIFFPYYFELINQFGEKQKPSTTLIEVEDLLTIKELASGGMIEGSLIFEVPEYSENLQLSYHIPSLLGTDSILIDLELENEVQSVLKPSLSFNQDWMIGNRLDPIQLEKMSLTVFSFHHLNETSLLVAEEGKLFIVIEVQLENKDDVTKNYNPHDFKLLTSTGELLLPRLTLMDHEEMLQSGTLSPQELVEGLLVFEVDELITDFSLIYSPSHWEYLQKIMIPLF